MWHALVGDGHRSTAKLLSFSGLYTSKLRLLRASWWCFAMTSACKYPQLSRTKFWACTKPVCGQIGLECTLAGKSGQDPCEILTGACFLRNCGQQKLSPVTCPQGLPGKLSQGLYIHVLWPSKNGRDFPEDIFKFSLKKMLEFKLKFH